MEFSGRRWLFSIYKKKNYFPICLRCSRHFVEVSLHSILCKALSFVIGILRERLRGTDIDHDFCVFREYLLQPSESGSLGRTDILLDSFCQLLGFKNTAWRSLPLILSLIIHLGKMTLLCNSAWNC